MRARFFRVQYVANGVSGISRCMVREEKCGSHEEIVGDIQRALGDALLISVLDGEGNDLLASQVTPAPKPKLEPEPKAKAKPAPKPEPEELETEESEPKLEPKSKPKPAPEPEPEAEEPEEEEPELKPEETEEPKQNRREIYDLGLSQRAINALEAAGLTTVEQIVSHPDLTSIKGIGESMKTQILQAIAKHAAE